MNDTPAILREILSLAGLFHDLGKITASWQARLERPSAGPRIFSHELLSALLMRTIAREIPGTTVRAIDDVATLSLLHDPNSVRRTVRVAWKSMETLILSEKCSIHEFAEAKEFGRDLSSTFRLSLRDEASAWGQATLLVLTHHRNADCKRDRILADGFFGPGKFTRQDAGAALRIHRKGVVPWEDAGWLEDVARSSRRLATLVRSSNEWRIPELAPFTSVVGRFALMSADHVASHRETRPEGASPTSEGMFANQVRTFPGGFDRVRSPIEQRVVSGNRVWLPSATLVSHSRHVAKIAAETIESTLVHVISGKTADTPDEVPTLRLLSRDRELPSPVGRRTVLTALPGTASGHAPGRRVAGHFVEGEGMPTVGRALGAFSGGFATIPQPVPQRFDGWHSLAPMLPDDADVEAHDPWARFGLRFLQTDEVVVRSGQFLWTVDQNRGDAVLDFARLLSSDLVLDGDPPPMPDAERMVARMAFVSRAAGRSIVGRGLSPRFEEALRVGYEQGRQTAFAAGAEGGGHVLDDRPEDPMALEIVDAPDEGVLAEILEGPEERVAVVLPDVGLARTLASGVEDPSVRLAFVNSTMPPVAELHVASAVASAKGTRLRVFVDDAGKLSSLGRLDVVVVTEIPRATAEALTTGLGAGRRILVGETTAEAFEGDSPLLTRWSRNQTREEARVHRTTLLVEPNAGDGLDVRRAGRFPGDRKGVAARLDISDLRLLVEIRPSDLGRMHDRVGALLRPEGMSGAPDRMMRESLLGIDLESLHEGHLGQQFLYDPSVGFVPTGDN